MTVSDEIAIDPAGYGVLADSKTDDTDSWLCCFAAIAAMEPAQYVVSMDAFAPEAVSLIDPDRMVISGPEKGHLTVTRCRWTTPRAQASCPYPEDLPVIMTETGCAACHGAGVVAAPPVLADDAADRVPCTCPAASVYPEGWHSGSFHPLVFARAAGYVALVDEGIREDLERLWDAGVVTRHSCQGDGLEPGAVMARYVVVHSEDVSRSREMLPWVVDAKVTSEAPEFTALYGVMPWIADAVREALDELAVSAS